MFSTLTASGKKLLKSAIVALMLQYLLPDSRRVKSGVGEIIHYADGLVAAVLVVRGVKMAREIPC